MPPTRSGTDACFRRGRCASRWRRCGGGAPGWGCGGAAGAPPLPAARGGPRFPPPRAPPRRRRSRQGAGGNPVRAALLRLGEWLGALAWLLRLRRAVARDGLRRAFPDLTDAQRKKIGRASYVQLGRSLAEILLPLRDEDLATVRTEGWEILERGLAQGRGLVGAIAHFGNFELLARVSVRRGLKLSVIVRQLRDPFGRWLLADRTRMGIGQLFERGSTREALAVLRRGATLAIAVDQNMRPARGIFVDFFGEKACTTPAAAG